MPFKILLFLSITLLAACSPQIIGPAAMPTETATPAPSPTPTPEATATETPTPTETAVPTETFAPMELSTNPDRPGKCTYEDVTSGRLAWNVKQHLKPWPEGAKNYGWDEVKDAGYAVIPTPGSISPESSISFCEISGDFLGKFDEKFIIMSVQILNTDGTTGIVNLLTSEHMGPYMITDRQRLNAFGNANKLINVLKKSNGRGIGLWESPSVDAQRWWKNDKDFGFMLDLYDLEGRSVVEKNVGELKKTGTVPNDLEKLLLVPIIAGGFR